MRATSRRRFCSIRSLPPASAAWSIRRPTDRSSRSFWIAAEQRRAADRLATASADRFANRLRAGRRPLLAAAARRTARATRGSKRLDWLAEETATWLDEVRASRERPRWRKVSGIGNMSLRSLAIVRELWMWRQAEAERRDVPPRRVLRDDLIVELAKRKSDQPEKIRAIRGIQQSVNRQLIDQLAACIRRGLEVPLDDLEREPHESMPSQLNLLGQFLSPALTSICRSANVATSLAGTASDVRDLIAYRLNFGGRMRTSRRCWPGLACRAGGAFDRRLARRQEVDSNRRSDERASAVVRLGAKSPTERPSTANRIVAAEAPVVGGAWVLVGECRIACRLGFAIGLGGSAFLAGSMTLGISCSDEASARWSQCLMPVVRRNDWLGALALPSSRSGEAGGGRWRGIAAGDGDGIGAAAGNRWTSLASRSGDANVAASRGRRPWCRLAAGEAAAVRDFLIGMGGTVAPLINRAMLKWAGAEQPDVVR